MERGNGQTSQRKTSATPIAHEKFSSSLINQGNTN